MRKPTHKSLKKTADTLFSLWIRRNGVCEWCGTRNANQYHCSHIFSRRFLVTRWNPLNAVSMCFQCHRKWHDHPSEGKRWIKEYLGESVYYELERLAKTGVEKIDIAEKIEMIKQYKNMDEL